ncbi:hypothetical protein SK128_004924, partial [Halocaridina rubra]
MNFLKCRSFGVKWEDEGLWNNITNYFVEVNSSAGIKCTKNTSCNPPTSICSYNSEKQNCFLDPCESVNVTVTGNGTTSKPLTVTSDFKPPKYLQVTELQESTMTIEWDKPDGLEPSCTVQNYNVTWHPPDGEKAELLSNDTETYHITGLIPCSNYTIDVLAIHDDNCKSVDRVVSQTKNK